LRRKIERDRADRLIALIKKRALFVDLKSAILPVSRDPKDDVFVACAFHASAEFIVTGDNDLLCLQQYEKTQIVTPRQFIEFLQTI